VHGRYVIGVRGRVLSERRGGMPWVPEITPCFLLRAIFGRPQYKKRSLTHQYRISASSCRSSVPAATVRPSEDTSQEKRVLCSPSNGTIECHGSLLSCKNILACSRVHRVARTLNRCGTRAVIPYTHDPIISRGNDHSFVCAGNRVDSA
jgi:hypothetical protein